MKITSPSRAYRIFRKHLCSDVEEVWVMALNSEKEVMRMACLFRGTVDRCLFHPRDVFRFACVHNAAAILVAHNHPQGRAAPSEEDVLVTQRLMLAAELLQIPIVDHLILAEGRYYSFLHNGLSRSDPSKAVWPSEQSPD